MQVHKVTLMIVDHDRLGADEVMTVLENQKYPNWCIYPRVMRTETAEIGDWTDDHPLNTNQAKLAFDELFK